MLTVEAGDTSVKRLRKRREAPLQPGGVVADYVPFYFGYRSPMMFKIDRGGVPTYSGDCDDLVYLVTTVERLARLGCQCCSRTGTRQWPSRDSPTRWLAWTILWIGRCDRRCGTTPLTSRIGWSGGWPSASSMGACHGKHSTRLWHETQHALSGCGPYWLRWACR